MWLNAADAGRAGGVEDFVRSEVDTDEDGLRSDARSQLAGTVNGYRPRRVRRNDEPDRIGTSLHGDGNIGLTGEAADLDPRLAPQVHERIARSD